MVTKKHPELSLRQQCRVLQICRSTVYYKAVSMNELNLELTAEIDRQYMDTPFYGRPRMTAHLRAIGHAINPKRVRRLMGIMGLRGITPRLNLSKRNPKHTIYPYLLRGLEIVRPNQVWATDITYIRMKRGFMYLAAVIDLFSRRVLSWRLSNTLDVGFCVEALSEALEQSPERPEIFNTDQGSQFTSDAFTAVLKQHEIRISMDGKGRALDNVFVERLWRSVKYECVYLQQFETVPDLRDALKAYLLFFNAERYHQSLRYQTPNTVYFNQKATEGVVEEGYGSVENSSSLRTIPQPRRRLVSISD